MLWLAMPQPTCRPVHVDVDWWWGLSTLDAALCSTVLANVWLTQCWPDLDCINTFLSAVPAARGPSEHVDKRKCQAATQDAAKSAESHQDAGLRFEHAGSRKSETVTQHAAKPGESDQDAGHGSRHAGNMKFQAAAQDAAKSPADSDKDAGLEALTNVA